MHKILIVEDDLDLCEVLRLYLTKAGYEVSVVHNSQDTLSLLDQERFDLILLDIMLPDGQGTDTCMKIRKRIFCPVLFISCIHEEDKIIKALEMGGDDYIVKPFNFKELIARIQSNLRRVDMDTKVDNTMGDNIIRTNDIVIKLEKRTVYKGNEQVYLSPTEFDILIYMVNNPGKTLSYDEIFKNIWNGDSLGDIRTVMVHVSNLRKKIEEDVSNPRYIKTVRKLGYIFGD